MLNLPFVELRSGNPCFFGFVQCRANVTCGRDKSICFDERVFVICLDLQIIIFIKIELKDCITTSIC